MTGTRSRTVRTGLIASSVLAVSRPYPGEHGVPCQRSGRSAGSAGRLRRRHRVERLDRLHRWPGRPAQQPPVAGEMVYPGETPGSADVCADQATAPGPTRRRDRHRPTRHRPTRHRPTPHRHRHRPTRRHHHLRARFRPRRPRVGRRGRTSTSRCRRPPWPRSRGPPDTCTSRSPLSSSPTPAARRPGSQYPAAESRSSRTSGAARHGRRCHCRVRRCCRPVPVTPVLVRQAQLAGAYKQVIDTLNVRHLDIDIEAPVNLDVMNRALAQVQRERPAPWCRSR